MSSEIVEKRRRWYNSIKPGDLVRYDEWGHGYTNKPVMILSIKDRFLNRQTLLSKAYLILMNDNKLLVNQNFISPLDGWENIDRE